ncbi:MAG: CRTAC1 family protein [Thermoanaerobaculia bacterium]|nr:CRTAC1 family protein [Thermoanaerobaculia bacterium]
MSLRTASTLLLPTLLATLPAVAQPATEVPIPAEDVGIQTLEARARAQLETRRLFRVFHDFRFEDRRPESGITFRNLVTEDNLTAFKATHYDHGNGVAVADVDGDGLHDVYFVTQLGANELYRNRGGGRFENVTEAAGVALDDRVSIAAAFADVDNDGDPDLFVTSVRGGNALLLNDGEGRFSDMTGPAGLAHIGHSSGAFFLDYDNDGHLDLFVTNVGEYTTDQRGPGGYWVGYVDAFSGHLFPERTETSLLYRNLGGNRFIEVSEETGLVDPGWSGDGTFTDLDGNLYPEVYVLNMQGDDRYWVNVAADDGGRRFEERTARFFPRTPWGAMGVKFFDWNNDGRLDLYLTDMHSDMSREVGPSEEKLKSVMMWSEEHLQGGENNIFGNAFYENRGEDGFRELSDPLGLENYWPWGFSAADLNADGWQDLFVASSMSFPFRYGINSVLLNDAGARFRDAEFILGVEPRRDGLTRFGWFDLDCSGEHDSRQECHDRDGVITVTGTVGTRSSAVFDLEGDGDLDIVTNEFYWYPQVLVSDLSEKKEVHFLEVELVGTRSNRDGLGARVEVHVGDDVYTRYHDGKSGYLSQSSLPLYFGLGDAEKVDRVVVRWPSGIEQTVTEGIGINRRLEIREAG